MKKLLRTSVSLPLLGALFLSQAFAADPETKQPIKGKELVQKRDRNAKHFAMPDGTFKAKIYAGAQHYMDDNGQWQDINTDLVNNVVGAWPIQNLTNTVKSHFPTKIGFGNYVKIESETGGIITMGENPFTAYMNSEMELGELTPFTQSSVGMVSGNELVYSSPGITDHQYQIEWETVKHNVLLKQVPTQLAGVQDGYMVFGEELSLPAGWKMQLQRGKMEIKMVEPHGVTIQGSITLLDENGTPALSIPLPDVYEQGNPSSSIYADGQWPVSYAINPLPGSGKYQLMTIVPMDWLNEAGRQFPVVVDPTVNVVGNWGGWQDDGTGVVESNPTTFVFVGALGTDHRGWTLYDITSVPDNSLVTDVEAEFVMNGTGSGGVLDVDINDVTGAYGPYNNVNVPAAFTDFGNGLYTAFSCSTAATYSAINLGSQAVFDVQAQLPVDEFQLALDNGNNADWKRFTSNLNNLDITYVFCTPPTFALDVVTDVDCFGNDNGMVTTTASGGVPPYSYLWTSGDTTSSADSLAPGNYIVTIYDDTGCFDTLHVNIDEPDTMTIAITETPVLCFGESTGQAEAVPTGGVAPYTYLWSSGGTAALETGLPMGMHSVDVTDDNGCVYSESVMVTEPTELVSVVDTVLDVTCSGDSNGSIQTSTSGGIIPYVISWDDPNAQVSPTAINLPEGLWTMLATDANGCQSFVTDNVGNVFNAPILNLTSPVSAGGENFADLTAPSGFSSYLWSNGANTPTLRVFFNGIYTLTVTDDNGCSNSGEIEVTDLWPTSIAELSDLVSVSLYPNPAVEGVSQLEVDGLNGEQLSMSITNVQGQVVLQQQWGAVQGLFRETIDLSAQAKGMYFIQLSTTHSTTTLRLTIQ